MTLGITQFTTALASFEEDVAAYRAAGFDAIGVCEVKLPQGRDAECLALVRESGLGVSAAVPTTVSILPLPFMEGPSDPEERVEAFKTGMRRLAPFDPSCIVCLTGPPGELPREDARRIVVDALRELGREAERLGLRIGLEPIQREYADLWTLVSTLGETAELTDEAGSPAIGLLFDTWHVWNDPDVLDDIAMHGDRIVGVHVADWREPTRNTNDRVLPGDGVIDLARLLAAVREVGWSGAYDLEIFSDAELPDSLWKLPAHELARKGRAALESALPA